MLEDLGDLLSRMRTEHQLGVSLVHPQKAEIMILELTFLSDNMVSVEDASEIMQVAFLDHAEILSLESFLPALQILPLMAEEFSH